MPLASRETGHMHHRDPRMGVIVSVNVGRPQDVAWQGRTVRTAVWKAPVAGRIFARRLNLDGDGQADIRAHGGEQRALLVYQLESYQHWANFLARSDLVAGNFGENLTVEGLADSEVCIGDRFRIGGTIVEGTAGNTGIGLTLVGNARGYRCVIVIPETQSREKIDFLRMIGADVRLVPAKPYRDPGNYVHVSRRMAEETGAVWANQFDNLANREGHRTQTGPEIWEQTDGKVDAFTCACGSSFQTADGTGTPKPCNS